LGSDVITKAVLNDWRSAPVSPKTLAMFAFLEKMTLSPDSLGPADGEALRAAGVSPQAAEDGILVGFLFNIYDRLADSLEFDIPDAIGFQQGADFLLKSGYQMD
jgi:alkylhydroperoxidase family enzyme